LIMPPAAGRRSSEPPGTAGQYPASQDIVYRDDFGPKAHRQTGVRLGAACCGPFRASPFPSAAEDST
jgi:hypothetical protein